MHCVQPERQCLLEMSTMDHVDLHYAVVALQLCNNNVEAAVAVVDLIKQKLTSL